MWTVVHGAILSRLPNKEVIWNLEYQKVLLFRKCCSLLVQRWNNLSQEDIDHKTLNGFKKALETRRRTKMDFYELTVWWVLWSHSHQLWVTEEPGGTTPSKLPGKYYQVNYLLTSSLITSVNSVNTKTGNVNVVNVWKLKVWISNILYFCLYIYNRSTICQSLIKFSLSNRQLNWNLLVRAFVRFCSSVANVVSRTWTWIPVL